MQRVDEQKLLHAAVEHHKAGRFQEAKDLYRAILTQNPRNTDAIHRIGTLALQVEQYEKAADFIGQAIELGPATATMYINYGTALRNIEKYDEAVDAYNRALDLEPNRTDALFNKGRALQAAEKYEEATATYESVITLDERDDQAWLNLGTVQKVSGDTKAAIYSFETAARLNPDLGPAYGNMGSILLDKAMYETALILFEQAIALDANDARFRYHKSSTLLLLGKLEQGWEDFDMRFKAFKEARQFRRPEPPPYWDGKNAEGKCVLLWTEQGIGEQILAVSALQDFMAAGGKCVLECEKRLIPIFKRSFPGIQVRAHQEHFEILEQKTDPIDFQLPAYNLLKIYRSSKSDIPQAGPHIKPKSDLRAQLRARYEQMADGRRIVGISWMSTNKNLSNYKSALLTDWNALIKDPRIFVVSLQYGDYEDEIKDYTKQFSGKIYVDETFNPLEDLENALAQIAAMDLVISISNSNIHMAGAMGVPTWLLLSKSPGLLWFWFSSGTESPWYPSVRIFRQQTAPDFDKPWWPEVIGTVAGALEDWLTEPLPPRIEP